MRKMVLVAVLCWAASMLAAGPGCATSETPLVFRSETAEVHVTFTAVGDHNQLVTDLTPQDFKVLRDGAPVDSITDFENLKHSPLSLIILSDVSDSMRKALPIENLAKTYLSQNLSSESDSVSFLDFGTFVHPAQMSASANTHLTSMYDSLLKVVRQQTSNKTRQAVLLISDGGDNYSLHNVSDVIAAAQRRDISFYVLNTDPWNEEGGRDLRTLAEQTGGRYYVIEKRKQVLPALQEIESELRNTYMVTFRAGSSGKGLHQLAMKPTDKNLTFFHRTSYYQTGDASTPQPSLLATANH